MQTEKPVDKAAMDAAITAAVKIAQDETMKRIDGIHAAKENVRPWTNDLHGAFDSADAVYRAALTIIGFDSKDLHPTALWPVLQAQPKPGHGSVNHVIAQDSTPLADLEKTVPGYGRVRSV